MVITIPILCNLIANINKGSLNSEYNRLLINTILVFFNDKNIVSRRLDKPQNRFRVIKSIRKSRLLAIKDNSGDKKVIIKKKKMLNIIDEINIILKAEFTKSIGFLESGRNLINPALKPKFDRFTIIIVREIRLEAIPISCGAYNLAAKLQNMNPKKESVKAFEIRR